VGDQHRSKYRRSHYFHSVHVSMSEQDVVIERLIDNLNVDKDGFSPEFNGDILKYPFKRRWSSVISSQSDGEWYEFRRAKFFPYSFGHDACGCTFINDTSMNRDVSNLDWYLESYQSRETRFPTI
jgi:hypothetical protein